jgi:hypothetical protein
MLWTEKANDIEKKVINCTVSQFTKVSPGLKIIYIYKQNKMVVPSPKNQVRMRCEIAMKLNQSDFFFLIKIIQ